MWFKDFFLFLSYTALLVAPTNAAFDGPDNVVPREPDNLPVSPEQVAYHPIRRAQPWSNQTTTSQPAHKPPPVPPPPVKTPVEVIPTDSPKATSTVDQKHETSQGASSSAEASKSPSPPANNPGRTSNVIPTSEALHPPPPPAFTPPRPSSQNRPPVFPSLSSLDHVGQPPVPPPATPTTAAGQQKPSSSNGQAQSFSTSSGQRTQTQSDSSVITPPPKPSIPLPIGFPPKISSIEGEISEIISAIESKLIPSPIGGILSSLLSDVESVLKPPGTGIAIPPLGLVTTSISPSSVPTLESKAPSGSMTNQPADLSPTAPGISRPGFSGTAPLSSSSGTPTGTLQPSASGSPTNTPTNSGNTPTLVPTGQPGSATSPGMKSSIHVSESSANPTVTPINSLSTRPGQTPTAGISGSTGGTAVSSSGVGVSVTKGFTGPSTGAIPTRSPTGVDKASTSGQASLSNGSSGSIYASGSSAVSGATASGGSTVLSGASTVPSGGYGTHTASISGPNGFIVSTTVPPATSSTTAGAGGEEPKPAPLSKSQTAGIAIGGTTCLIIAIAAALFLARRYHTNAANKRHSTGSIYPEVAYLYDPPVPRNDDDAEAGGGVPTMSGGASGYGAVPRNSPASSPRESHHARNSTVGSNYANPFRDPIIPSPQPSPRLNGYGGPVGDARGEYAELSINPVAFNPAARNYPPMSPYGPTPMDDRVASNKYSDPFSDPFEHDLLLNVDVRSETPDSILVLAPPPTPRSPRFPGRYSPENAAASSSQTSLAPPGRYTPSPEKPSSNALPHDRHAPDTAPVSSPLATHEPTTPPPPVHKGWEEIKLAEAVLIPKPLSIVTDVPRKPMPARPTPALAGAGQMLLSGQGLPLTVKRKDVDRDLDLEVPSMNQVYSSLGPAVDEQRNPNTAVQEKRSNELLFADPHLIGRNF